MNRQQKRRLDRLDSKTAEATALITKQSEEMMIRWFNSECEEVPAYA